MSPAKDKIGGPRPSPLKIHKHSRSLHKSSFSSSSSSNLCSIAEAAAEGQNQNPVIIYTDSPKIIHTEPKDFMTLVQKLTGISAIRGGGGGAGCCTNARPPQGRGDSTRRFGWDENDSSSILTEEEEEEENCFGENRNGGPARVMASSPFDSVPPMVTAMNPYFQDLADVPLFTPNYNSFPANFYDSPRTFFGYPSEY